jgi:hypothetical protein
MSGECEECGKKRLDLQTKLKVSDSNDVYEQEADRIAEHIVHMGRRPAVGNLPTRIQRSSRESSGQMDGALSSVEPILAGSGAPLDHAVRQEMEQRFGHDFSRVRVHSDEKAAASARSLEALAYTVGRDVVFAEGQYAPHTDKGTKLLAHELTHVLQQNTDTFRVQRMSIGTGTPPSWGGRDVTTVPADDLDRVNEAIGLVREIAENSQENTDCHQFFSDRCPGGGPNTLRDIFSHAVLWKLDEHQSLLGRLFAPVQARGDVSGENIAYTQSGYNSGAEGLARTLVHEMMHNCGVSGDDHYLADVAGLYCTGPGRNLTAIAGGATSGGEPIELITYRRFLTNWASGRLRPSLGADVNVIGLTLEARRGRTEGREFGSATVGIHGRTNFPFGRERFGGLTGSVDTGFGVGRFTLTPVRGGSETAVAPDWVLQVGTGAQFYLPIGSQAVPVTVEAAYRLAIPLNIEGERVQSLLLSVGISH